MLTVKVGVDSLLHEGTRAEVDQLEIKGAQVHQEVLVLDVSMDDSLAVASDDGLDNLAEEVPRQLLFEHPLLGDEVEEVLAWSGLLHDIDEGVIALVEVDEADDSGYTLDLGQELELQWDSSSIKLQMIIDDHKYKVNKQQHKCCTSLLTTSQSVTLALATCLMATVLPSLIL